MRSHQLAHEAILNLFLIPDLPHLPLSLQLVSPRLSRTLAASTSIATCHGRLSDTEPDERHP